MTRMAPKNIAMLAIVVAIFVAAVVLVIVGVATHEEPGFMDPDVRWDHIPLDVTCRGYSEDNDGYCEIAEHVTGIINGRLGFTAFRWLSDGEDGHADVTITIGVPSEPGWMDPGGDATLVKDGGFYKRCDIRTSNTDTTEMLSLVLYHELGHCLGLAHDDYGLSIMRPVQEPTPHQSIPPWISDYDRRILRERYVDGQ